MKITCLITSLFATTAFAGNVRAVAHAISRHKLSIPIIEDIGLYGFRLRRASASVANPPY